MKKLNLTIQMHDPVGTILSELQDRRITQDSVAITYAFVMAQHGDEAPYSDINTAILKRWVGRRSLETVKVKAWKHYERWVPQLAAKVLPAPTERGVGTEQGR